MHNLGSNWAINFAKALLETASSISDVGTGDSIIDSDGQLSSDNQFYKLMFNLYLITYYQATNIAEALMTQ
jgi:hypothetical protein